MSGPRHGDTPSPAPQSSTPAVAQAPLTLAQTLYPHLRRNEAKGKSQSGEAPSSIANRLYKHLVREKLKAQSTPEPQHYDPVKEMMLEAVGFRKVTK